MRIDIILNKDIFSIDLYFSNIEKSNYNIFYIKINNIYVNIIIIC